MITGQEILQALHALGIDNWLEIAQDKNYVCPTRQWLAGPFKETWKRTLQAMGLTEWRQDAWDCEDFTDLCIAMIKACHGLFYKGEAGIAVGKWLYRPDWSITPQNPQGTGHAVVMAVVSESPIVITWFEPQIAKGATEPKGIISLTKTEFESCYGEIFSQVR